MRGWCKYSCLTLRAESWISRFRISALEKKPISNMCALYRKQCCGSGSGSTGSTCFWASLIRIRIHLSEVWIRIRILLWIRIRILLSWSKCSKKNLDFYCLWLLFDFLSFKNDVKVPSKSNLKENLFLNLFFVGILKVNDESRRIRIRIRIRIH